MIRLIIVLVRTKPHQRTKIQNQKAWADAAPRNAGYCGTVVCKWSVESTVRDDYNNPRCLPIRVHSVQLCSFNVKQCRVSCETADDDALCTLRVCCRLCQELPGTLVCKWDWLLGTIEMICHACPVFYWSTDNHTNGLKEKRVYSLTRDCILHSELANFFREIYPCVAPFFPSRSPHPPQVTGYNGFEVRGLLI